MSVRGSTLLWRLGLAVLLLCLAAGSTALAAVEVYPVSEVGRGAVGVGYTVVQGTRIESFTVEVLGVMERAGPAGSLILVRTSGDVIDRSGGIAAGMSGSPVFVDGKLLGAIGYAFDMADHRIGLVTPASDMLAVMELIQPEGDREEADAASKGAGDPVAPAEPAAGSETASAAPSGIVLAPSARDAKRLTSLVPPDVWVASPVATPLVARGLGGRAMDRLRRVFEGYDVIPMQAGGPPGGEEIAPVIAPGAAIGVQLVRGDVDLTAIGTLTAVDGQRFIAFGHPLFNRGEVDHFATGAYIHHTVPAISLPFKLGAALAPIGSLLQDRGAAIAGMLGRSPESIALDVRVSDRDRGVQKEFHAQVVNDKELTVPLIVVAALEAVDRSLDRIGAGTATVRVRIDGDGMPRPLSRENVFYSGADIAGASLSELLLALDLLQENEFQDPKLKHVAVEIEAAGERKTARIERARPSASTVRQGESVDVVVTLRPFRAPAFDVTVPLEIPQDIAAGTVTVTVRGGAFGDFAPLAADVESNLAIGAGDDSDEESHLSIEAESLEKLIDEFEKEPKNNEVVVEFYPPSFYDGGAGSLSSDDHGFDEAYEEGEYEEDEYEANDHHHGPSDDEEASDGEPAGEGGAENDSDAGGDDDGERPQDAPGDDVESERPIRAILPTGYVIHGEAQFTLTIEEGPGERRENGEERPSAPAPHTDPWAGPGAYPINAH